MHVGSPWQGGWHEWERKGGVNASFSMGGISLFQWLSMYRRRGDCWIFWHIRWPCPQFSFMVAGHQLIESLLDLFLREGGEARQRVTSSCREKYTHSYCPVHSSHSSMQLIASPQALSTTLQVKHQTQHWVSSCACWAKNLLATVAEA